jgi:hypothetical protein
LLLADSFASGGVEISESDLAAVHYEIVQGLLRRHACPSNEEIGAAIGVSIDRVEDILRELAAIHGVVLHPHVCEPWVVHPFSVTPTPHWIEGRETKCWAPCIWCAFGVATLAGGEVRIHSRIAGGAEPVTIRVFEGMPMLDAGQDLWVHFAIPPKRAWDNVHQHCSLVLPFRSPCDIDKWCAEHRQPCGEAVPLAQVARLAKAWYGRHADQDWRKWTMAQAQEIFHGAGLTGPFWDLGAAPGQQRF